MTAKSTKKETPISFKVIGLMASIVTILACFVGAVTWISLNMAENAVSITVLQQTQIRHEALISKNSQIIQQHARLLAILEQHSRRLDILTDFMTQGGRFTESDGRRLHQEVEIVKDKLQDYKVLETELEWIKQSISRMEKDIARRFDGLHKKLDINRKQ